MRHNHWLRRGILLGGLLAAFAAPATASTFKTLSAFKGAKDGVFAGSAPTYLNGALYGTTTAGGSAGAGCIYRIAPATGAESVVYTFTGQADGSTPSGLVAYGNALYGVAGGGAGQGGIAFSFDPSSGSLKVLHNFGAAGADFDGKGPVGPLVVSGSLLYGATTYSTTSYSSGTIFSIDPASGAEAVVRAFSETDAGRANPGGLLALGGLLYGTASSGGLDDDGVVFSVDPATGAENILYDFTGQADGGDPFGPLTSVGGVLYGTLTNGGANSIGGIFSLNPRTGKESLVASFDAYSMGGGNGLAPVDLVLLGSALYGIAAPYGENGSVYRYDLTTGTLSTLYAFAGGIDGSLPSGLMHLNGALIASTIYGGAGARGAVARIDPATGAETVLHSFVGAYENPFAIGYGSQAGLTSTAAGLFAATTQTGAHGLGEILQVMPGGGPAPIVEEASAAAGLGPNAGLFFANGLLWGTTQQGGAYGKGAIVQIDPAHDTQTAIYSFGAAAGGGITPAAGLIASNGALFGTTFAGGAANCGTIFRFSPASKQAVTLYSFLNKGDGCSPAAPLVSLNGLLYGTASGYGGTVFSVNPVTGAFATVFGFQDLYTGVMPQAGLTVVDGMLYGLAQTGGTGEAGLLFRIDPATGAETVLHNFMESVDGAAPSSTMLYFGGKLYATLPYGGPSGGGGTIFRYDPVSGQSAVVYSFTGAADGGLGAASLVNFRGALYGTTSSGGAGGAGTVYRFTP